MTVDPDVLAERLRRWSELSSRPLVVPPERPPTEQEVADRLREAFALWVAAARLGDLTRSR